MELKIGDKVRYLDAVGGGTITAFKGKDLVMVLEADGFETPVLRRQCVGIQPEAKPAPEPVKPVQTTVRPPLERKRLPIHPGSDRLVIKLAFLPAEDQAFNEAAMECYLINDSPYELLYNYALIHNNAWLTVQAGRVEPNTKLYLETFARDTLNDRGHCGLQVLAFKPEAYYKGRQPLSKEIKVETVKFYKIHCFKENPYFEEDALLVDVFDD